MPEIPAPLRAALGLVAEAVDRARALPEQAPELPVQIVSGAMRASLRAQQRYAELTSRGDELLSQLRGPSDDPPSWATFDDEVDAAEADATAQRLGVDADADPSDLEAAVEDPVAPSAPPKSTSPRGPSGRGSAADAEPAKRGTSRSASGGAGSARKAAAGKTAGRTAASTKDTPRTATPKAAATKPASGRKATARKATSTPGPTPSSKAAPTKTAPTKTAPAKSAPTNKATPGRTTPSGHTAAATTPAAERSAPDTGPAPSAFDRATDPLAEPTPDPSAFPTDRSGS